MTTPPPQTDELAQLAELAELTELTEDPEVVEVHENTERDVRCDIAWAVSLRAPDTKELQLI